MSTMLAEFSEVQQAKADAVLISVTPEVIAKTKEYLTLTCKGPQDKAAFEAVSKALAQCKGYKGAIEDQRVSMKEPHLKRGREIDASAKRLQEELAPVLIHLTQQENAVKAELKRLADESAERAHTAKMQRLKDAGLEMSDAVVRSLTGLAFETEFQRLTQQKIIDDAAKKRLAEQQAELDRLKAEQAERQKEIDAQRKIEAERLAEERRQLDAQRVENERVRQEQIKAQQAIAEREAQERLRVAREEAAERSRIETEKRIHDEEMAKIAKAAHAAAVATDIEKVRQIAVDLGAVRLPDVTDFEAAAVVNQIREAITWAIETAASFGK